MPLRGKNAGSLSGNFIALTIILSPNLLPSPDKFMGLPQHIFEEVVAEWRIKFIQCIWSMVSFYCWINKKGSKILTYTYFFQRRWTWSWIKQRVANLAKCSDDTCVRKYEFQVSVWEWNKINNNLKNRVHGKIWAFYFFVAVQHVH